MLFYFALTLTALASTERDYSKNSYVIIQSTPTEILKISRLNNAKIISTLPMLEDHYTLEIPKTSLYKRSLPVDTFYEEQVPYTHLYKRDTESKEMIAIRDSLDLRDPGFSNQWHLFNQDHLDMNITSVWAQNITGDGVTVAFIDDGIDHENPDLKENFSLEGSWDFNFKKQLPTPSLDDDTHGTRCAGEVGAVKNDVCGVGVAYKSKVAGIRILSGRLTNEDEAASVTFNCNSTQIYSCSWGPRDDGRTMEGPPEIVKRSFDQGIKYCRNGLGALYVFAAGNGGNSGDNCNFDGYTNSIYTITVAAMDNQQNHPWYSERCSAILISAYSSKGANMGGIYTTDWKDGCSEKHGGTSAAAPLASGVYALLLQVRPDLNWRDVQRLTVENAVVVNPKDSDWHTNSAGRQYNHKYGYGTFDTWKLIESAKSYKNVGEQTQVVVESEVINGDIPAMNVTGLSNSITITKDGLAKAGLTRLEHVEVHVYIKHDHRGDVAISLTSPFGFKSQLIESRQYDGADSGFPGWRMMTVAHWDEDAVGNWTLTVVDNTNPDKKGVLEKWRLTLWGDTKAIESTKATPSPLSKKPVASSTLTATATNTNAATTTITSSSTHVAVNSTGNSTNTSGSIVKHFSSDSGGLLFVSFLGILLLALYFAWKRGLFKPPRVKIPKEEDFELEMLDQGDLHAGETDTVNNWNEEDFDNLVFEADEYV